jgi:hypothetical protein
MKAFTNLESSFVNVITSKTRVCKLSQNTREYLLLVISNVLTQILKNILTLAGHRNSQIPSLEDVAMSLEILKRDLTFISSENISIAAEDESENDADFDPKSDSESDGDDDETMSSEESQSEEEDEEEDEEEEDEGYASNRYFSYFISHLKFHNQLITLLNLSDMDNMYSDKENMSPLIDIFTLSAPPRTSLPFRDFVTALLETQFHSGLDLPDDVTYALEQFVCDQVRASFYAEADW